MVLMANRYILPAALEYQKQVAQSVAAVKSAGGTVGRRQEDPRQRDQADRRVQASHRQAATHTRSRKRRLVRKHAKHFRDAVIPAMNALRETGDELRADHSPRAVAARHIPRDAASSSKFDVGSRRRVATGCQRGPHAILGGRVPVATRDRQPARELCLFTPPTSFGALSRILLRFRYASSRDIWLLPTLSLFFFCLGACALTYQVLWLRLLGLVFGVTTYAASTVWASFMAGLA